MASIAGDGKGSQQSYRAGSTGGNNAPAAPAATNTFARSTGTNWITPWASAVDERHEKLDELGEAEAATATDIVWLKWAVRGVVAGGAGWAAWSGVL